MWEVFVHCGRCCPRKVVLDCIKQQTEQTMKGKPVISIFLRYPAQYLPVGLCLEFLPSISFSMGYNCIPLFKPLLS